MYPAENVRTGRPHLADHREQRAGVDAAGQEEAIRHVGAEVLQHDLAKQGLEFFHGLVEVERARAHGKRRPVAVLAHPELGIDDQRRARRQPMNPAHQDRLGGAEAVLEILHCTSARGSRSGSLGHTARSALTSEAKSSRSGS
jgi:hypothetical protein